MLGDLPLIAPSTFTAKRPDPVNAAFAEEGLSDTRSVAGSADSSETEAAVNPARISPTPQVTTATPVATCRAAARTVASSATTRGAWKVPGRRLRTLAEPIATTGVWGYRSI